MAEDQLRNVVDGIRARLQAELESQLGAVTESHEQALAEHRRTAEADAERRWAAKLEAVRAEWSARLQSEVAAARSEVERTMVAESMRVRVEAEQAAAEAASQARRELEQAIAAERKRAEAEVERAKAQTEQRAAAQTKAQIEEVRQRADRELAQARAAFDAERTNTADAMAEAQKASASAAASANGTAGILDAIRAIDSASSLSTALAAVARAAAAEAPRVALFIVNGTELQEWPVTGVPGVDSGPIRSDGREAGFLADVLRSGEPHAIGENGGAAPAFANLPPGRTAIAVPFMLGGQPVAVLYADEGTNGESSPGRWRDAVQILGRHTSAVLAYLTAMKTARAMQLIGGGQATASEDDAQGARRYARLLVSEIKLYNEGAVRVGRERRDLLQRLKAEIDRARKLYEERVAPSIRARDTYFQQELVQTLADGDPTLLG